MRRRLVGILEWFTEHQKKSQMKTEVIPLEESGEWKLQKDGTISRDDKAFYEGTIVRTSDGDKGWDALMLRSTGTHETHGVILLAKYRNKYLIQAKREPGNNTPGCVVLTSTIQASHENLRRNKSLPYVELIDRVPDFSVRVPQDAGMLYHKCNEFRLVVLRKKPAVYEGFYLATLKEIGTLAKQGLVSEHLLQVLGLHEVFPAS